MNKNDPRLGVRTWIDIDTKAIKNNYDIFRALIPPTTKLMAVVKSNAYGHGLVDFSKTVCDLGIDWLAVDSIVEALKLREEGITKPILVLGYTLPERMQEAVDMNISVTASSMFTIEGLKTLNLNGKIKIHIKIDSGMHRQGFMQEEIASVLDFLKTNTDKIEVEGLYTHFASAKNPKEPEFTHNQMKILMLWIDACAKAGFTPLKHAGATGATLLFPETYLDMVRVGIGFHGLWPSHEAKEFLDKKVKLMPTLTWKTIISEIKTIPQGDFIGYDFTEQTTRQTKIAVCPIGYWHGFPRSLSGIGNVLVHGTRAKVMGRVSMDMIVIDVTDVKDPKIGDEAVIIGYSEGNYLGAHDVAALIDMSVYELVTRINPLIKKIYL